tara:strand:+ start:1209 stop:2696 length:1488 start_codon:yes stop_codon:yes gene_type:complete
MAIKRYFATKDNTITNAFAENLTTRGTGSNMGAADILETFVIHGQTSASIDAENAEQARSIIEFPISTVSSDMAAGIIPNSSGSLKFYLSLYNAPHGNTLPEDFNLDIVMLSQSWTEGTGLDMDNYSDLGVSNWEQRSTGNFWDQTGAKYHIGNRFDATGSFPTGLENLSVDVSQMVYQWLNSEKNNNGFLIKLPDSIVSGSNSYYTKMFFSRTSEFFYYRPVLEARWNSSRKDNRANFYISSSMVPSADNLNTLFLYNVVRGQLANIPDLASDSLAVSIYSASDAGAGSAFDLDNGSNIATSVTGGLLVENGVVRTGIYTASFASTSSFATVYDVWHTGSGGQRRNFYTGSFNPISIETTDHLYDTQYINTITNLHDSYLKGQKPKLRVFARNKNWKPNIYTVATEDVVPAIIESAYYRLTRTIDSLEIIPFGTGSAVNNFTQMSYDVSGNYFELDTNHLESGYSYGIQFVYYLNGEYREQPEVFKFRIEEEEV